MSVTDPSAWIGRSQRIDDHLSANLLTRIAATFGQAAPAPGEALPPLWHWCFSSSPSRPRPWAAMVIRPVAASCHRPTTATVCGPVAAWSFTRRC